MLRFPPALEKARITNPRQRGNTEISYGRFDFESDDQANFIED